jgi:hypothetical protein
MKTLPGTDFPMPVYARKGPPRVSSIEARQRQALLAKIHIAKKELGLKSSEYEMMLASFKVASSADMTLSQLETLVKLMKRFGWKPRKSYREAKQAEALRNRCEEAAEQIRDGNVRLPGLVKKICGVSTLVWCRDTAKLKRLLAVLGKLKEETDER